MPSIVKSAVSESPVFIELWCNGNTSDFGSEILGSSPVTSTIIDNHGRDINALNGLVDDAVS